MSTSTCLSFSLFREQTNQELQDIIKKLPQSKNKAILTFPSYNENYSLRLISRDIQQQYFRGICGLKDIKETQNEDVIVVISPSDRNTVDEICTSFKRIPNYLKVLLLIPRNTALTQQAIEENGFKSVQSMPKNKQLEIWVHEFHADFLSLDDDFFVLPCINTFYQVEVENDFNDLYSAARALAKIQSVFGIIPQVFTLGSSSSRVYQLMNGILDQARISKTSLPQIDSLILIDRKVDLATPFATQMPFESFVDELFGIDYGILSYDNKNIIFSNGTPFFKEIRSLPIKDLVEYILKVRDEINDAKKNLNELKYLSGQEFRKRYLKIQEISAESYQNNLDAAFKIYEDITKIAGEKHPVLNSLLSRELDLMKNQEPLIDIIEKYALILGDWSTAIRLICLQSAVGKPLKKKIIETIEKEIFSEFGEEASESLITLEKLKLLSTNQYIDFAQLSKQLSLFESTGVEGDDELLNVCCNYVPLTVRLIQKATTNDWPGKWVKPFEEKSFPLEKYGEQTKQNSEDEIRHILVFFVGGITLSEMLYIRELEKLVFQDKVQFIIGSTDIINNTKLVNQICPFLSK